MKHPDVEGTTQVSRESFEAAWEPRGWVEVLEPEPVKKPPAGKDPVGATSGAPNGTV
jgi:hypothetical protein